MDQNWDLLYQKSTELAKSVDSAGYPRVERNLYQLEQLSRQLKAKAPRLDTAAEANAAARLLARQGHDVDQLGRDLRSFELKTMFEDVFPVEASTVEDYLRQVHEMSLLTSIQEAQRTAMGSFDAYLTRQMEADWQAEKKQFYHTFGRMLAVPPVQSMPAPQVAVTAAGVGATGPPAVVAARSGKYLEVVKELNAASRDRTPYTPMTRFGECCLGENPPPQVLPLWKLLKYLFREGHGASPLGDRPAAMELVQGARAYLEDHYVDHVKDVLKDYREAACLGGSNSNLDKIKAYLRVKLKPFGGSLDIDSQPTSRNAASTSWHQMFFLLRAGYYAEANQLASTMSGFGSGYSAAHGVGANFRSQVADWVDHNGQLSATCAQDLHAECDNLLRELPPVGLGDLGGHSPSPHGSAGMQRTPGPSPFRSQPPSQPAPPQRGVQQWERLRKMAVYAALCGHRGLAERLYREEPQLLPTLEDFLWYHLTLVRSGGGRGGGGAAARSSAPGGDFGPVRPLFFSPATPIGPGAGGRVAEGGRDTAESYTLDSLQEHLRRYSAKNYTNNGRDPLRYVKILLLSQQFVEAAQFLLSGAAVAQSARTRPASELASGALGMGGLAGGDGAYAGGGRLGGADGSVEVNGVDWIDVINLGVALASYRVLDQGAGAGAAGARGMLEESMASQLERFVAHHADACIGAGDLVAGLEYHAAARWVVGGLTDARDPTTIARWQDLVVRCCVDPRALDALVGPPPVPGTTTVGAAVTHWAVGRGQDPLLARFVGGGQELPGLLFATAQACQQGAKYREAVALFERAGYFGSALQVANAKLSELMLASINVKMSELMLARVSRVEPSTAMENDLVFWGKKGEALHKLAEKELESTGGMFGQQAARAEAIRMELDAYAQLACIGNVFAEYQASRWSQALQVARPCVVPLRMDSVDASCRVYSQLHPAVKQLVRQLVRVLAECIKLASSQLGITSNARMALGEELTAVSGGPWDIMY
eukprot:jgi/Mesvir1/21540/Mv03981-RA.2